MPDTDTIVALSTPPGRSSIGVIRLSGTNSLPLTRSLVLDESFAPEPNRAVLRSLHEPATGEVLDRALLTYFKAPHSFTGEDVVELSCHGSPVLLRQLLDILLKLDARLASPGEFTLRALANGRLNLSQAEAVRDLINAQTQAAVRQATRQLGGELSAYLQPVKDALVNIIVPLESALEFVEDDLPEILTDGFQQSLAEVIKKLGELSATFSTGKLIQNGIKITLVGRPNVGKSSVFNALLVSDRAIVTDIPGTTRDSLSETISIQGIPILLTDTAGIRVSTDAVETLGVDRTRRAIADADLLILILDGSQPLTEEDHDLLKEISETPHIIAINKSDLDSFEENVPENLSNRPIAVISISAKIGSGLDALRTAILGPFQVYDTSYAGLLVTNARHFDLLERTQSSLRASLNLLGQGASEELVLVGLYDGLRFLGEITGETTPDDILSQIFATFCIGK